MGRLINTSDLNNQIMLQKDRFGCLAVIISNVFEDIIRDTPTVEAIPKADYENRLKADMVAMLTEIQMEIEELQGKYSPYYDEASKNISWVIQEKINEVKEAAEGNERSKKV